MLARPGSYKYIIVIVVGDELYVGPSKELDITRLLKITHTISILLLHCSLASANVSAVHHLSTRVMQ